MQTGPSTQHTACDYAARCVNNRSALQWRLQRAAFLGAKCSGDFQGTEECSVVGVPHPYPERSAARCIMFRSYAKPPRGTSERTAAHDFVPAKGLWVSLTYLSPEQGTSLCQTVFTALPAARAQLGQFSAPLSPLYSNRRHTASPPPASAHGEVGRGLPMGA